MYLPYEIFLVQDLPWSMSGPDMTLHHEAVKFTIVYKDKNYNVAGKPPLIGYDVLKTNSFALGLHYLSIVRFCQRAGPRC